MLFSSVIVNDYSEYYFNDVCRNRYVNEKNAGNGVRIFQCKHTLKNNCRFRKNVFHSDQFGRTL